ncbi:hypothetical protein ALP03_200225 [Pseudomonas amygdali pv. tabaci]|uniref:Uncharacterized protein n=1 Tax=Pseudomonas amygdali pv. tabaci TaxID=322 RepID=A0A3M6HNL9_PSEAJ|nr:hypothetical protein ALP03_200225 [Pseudomonas amygdali pv. tabaci]
MTGQAGLNIARLDTQPVDFHLIVIAAEELEVAIRPLTHQIATAVQPVARNKGAVDKAFGVSLRQVQVTTGYSDTTDMQLTDNTQGHRLVIGIEYIQSRVADRATDRQSTFRHGLVGFQCPDTAIHRGFGRTINVVQACLRQLLA